ncbi:hypothetical protein WA026_000351, partial [Henosepilachna vigintioctopunctata]
TSKCHKLSLVHWRFNTDKRQNQSSGTPKCESNLIPVLIYSVGRLSKRGVKRQANIGNERQRGFRRHPPHTVVTYAGNKGTRIPRDFSSIRWNCFGKQ